MVVVAGGEPKSAKDAAEQLYGVPLEDFVSERNVLAKALKQAGKTEDAEVVAKLRKPPVPVWAVNQLARSRRKDVEKLVQSAERLRSAHGSSPTKFEAARKAEREALDALQKRAQELLAEAGRASDATLNKVRSTLQGAAARPETVDDLVAGTLAEEVEPPGFEALAGIQIKPQSKRATTVESKAASRRPGRTAVRTADAQAVARELAREARQAERDAEEARKRAERRDQGGRAAREATRRDLTQTTGRERSANYKESRRP